MTTVVIMFLTSALTLGAMPSAPTQAPVTDQDQASAGELVDLLWSPDHAQRRAAECKLVKLGAAAIPPLLSLLQDIASNPRTARFPIGREEEAHQALEHYRDYSPEDLYDLEITGRLRDDAAELLAQLHAVESVPLLIELMRRRVAIDWPRGLDRVMRSLVQIGAPAVPDLIQELESAASNASSLVISDEVAPSRSGGEPRLHGENTKWDRSREISIIQIRAVLVLGEIGDERALPALETLLLNDPSEPRLVEIESPYITRAIHNIREKSRSRK